MRNVLITGADGQLGREIRTCAEGSRHRWFFTDVAELDITDREAVRAFVAGQRIDVIVNCAAYTNVDRAEDEPDMADRINHLAVKNLADAAREFGATLLHVSTDYVFGECKVTSDKCKVENLPLTEECKVISDKCKVENLPLTEECPVAPLGVYGATKLAGERAIVASGCRYLIFRTAWLYSPHGRNFLKTMLELTASRDELNVVFDQAGTPTSAADLAHVICDRIETGDYAGREGIYHFSNEGVCSWYDFAHAIAALAGHTRCRIHPCRSAEFPTRAQRSAYSVLDKTKIKTTFGIEIPHWFDSLAICIARMNNEKLTMHNQ